MRLDTLYDIDFKRVRDGLLDVNTKLTHFKSAEYMTTIAAMFLLLCERFSVDPRKALEVADRVLRRASDRNPVELRAVRRYLREEIKES